LAQDLLEDALGMEWLVKDLLYLARSEASEQTQRGEPLDLADIVRKQAAGRDLVVVEAPTAAAMHGDPVALNLLVRNLLDNAVRHGRSKVLVEVQPRRLAVSDDGPGIPPELRERVFDRFFQADPARTRTAAGVGLGLAIVRSVAERHGGTVTIHESARLGGAEVVVSFP